MEQLFMFRYVMWRPYDSSNVVLPAVSGMRISLHKKQNEVKIIALLCSKERY